MNSSVAIRAEQSVTIVRSPDEVDTRLMSSGISTKLVTSEQGQRGVAGENGNKILVGPSFSGSQGDQGDVALVTPVFDLYQKGSSGWELKGNIKGEKGDPGPPGDLNNISELALDGGNF